MNGEPLKERRVNTAFLRIPIHSLCELPFSEPFFPNPPWLAANTMTMPDSPGRHFSPRLVAGLQRVQLVLTFLSGVTAAIAHPLSIVLHGLRDSVTSTFSVSAPWAIQTSYYLRVALLTTVA